MLSLPLPLFVALFCGAVRRKRKRGRGRCIQSPNRDPACFRGWLTLGTGAVTLVVGGSALPKTCPASGATRWRGFQLKGY